MSCFFPPITTCLLQNDIVPLRKMSFKFNLKKNNNLKMCPLLFQGCFMRWLWDNWRIRHEIIRFFLWIYKRSVLIWVTLKSQVEFPATAARVQICTEEFWGQRWERKWTNSSELVWFFVGAAWYNFKRSTLISKCEVT